MSEPERFGFGELIIVMIVLCLLFCLFYDSPKNKPQRPVPDPVTKSYRAAAAELPLGFFSA